MVFRHINDCLTCFILFDNDGLRLFVIFHWYLSYLYYFSFTFHILNMTTRQSIPINLYFHRNFDDIVDMPLNDHLLSKGHVLFYYFNHGDSLVHDYFLLDYDGCLNKDLICDKHLFSYGLWLWFDEDLDWYLEDLCLDEGLLDGLLDYDLGDDWTCLGDDLDWNLDHFSDYSLHLYYLLHLYYPLYFYLHYPFHLYNPLHLYNLLYFHNPLHFHYLLYLHYLLHLYYPLHFHLNLHGHFHHHKHFLLFYLHYFPFLLHEYLPLDDLHPSRVDLHRHLHWHINHPLHWHFLSQLDWNFHRQKDTSFDVYLPLDLHRHL